MSQCAWFANDVRGWYLSLSLAQVLAMLCNLRVQAHLGCSLLGGGLCLGKVTARLEAGLGGGTCHRELAGGHLGNAMTQQVRQANLWGGGR